MDCECLSACPFFNNKMQNKPGMAEMFKKKYCNGGEFDNCARYIVRKSLGKEKVPLDLYPNQMDAAKRIISQG